MLKVDEIKNLEILKQYGFHSYKVNRNQTNYYRCFAYCKQIIIIGNTDRRLVIDKWLIGDPRIHKIAKCHFKDTTQLMDVVYDLIMDGVIIKYREAENETI